MTLKIELDQDAAVALATVLRRVSPEAYGVNAGYRAVDALSPQLPATAALRRVSRGFGSGRAARLRKRSLGSTRCSATVY